MRGLSGVACALMCIVLLACVWARVRRVETFSGPPSAVPVGMSAGHLTGLGASLLGRANWLCTAGGVPMTGSGLLKAPVPGAGNRTACVLGPSADALLAAGGGCSKANPALYNAAFADLVEDIGAVPGPGGRSGCGVSLRIPPDAPADGSGSIGKVRSYDAFLHHSWVAASARYGKLQRDVADLQARFDATQAELVAWQRQLATLQKDGAACELVAAAQEGATRRLASRRSACEAAVGACQGARHDLGAWRALRAAGRFRLPVIHERFTQTLTTATGSRLAAVEDDPACVVGEASLRASGLVRSNAHNVDQRFAECMFPGTPPDVFGRGEPQCSKANPNLFAAQFEPLVKDIRMREGADGLPTCVITFAAESAQSAQSAEFDAFLANRRVVSSDAFGRLTRAHAALSARYAELLRRHSALGAVLRTARERVAACRQRVARSQEAQRQHVAHLSSCTARLASCAAAEPPWAELFEHCGYAGASMVLSNSKVPRQALRFALSSVRLHNGARVRLYRPRPRGRGGGEEEIDVAHNTSCLTSVGWNDSATSARLV